jgi:hypothetical protein
LDIITRGDKVSQKKEKRTLSTKSQKYDELDLEDVKNLGGDELDIKLVNTVEDDDEFETPNDELEADTNQK